ncbi:Ufm1-specific protease 2 [Cichlidogyrus casuarinus]|uniref:Ufm1-specific protease 2 n=1 Tax=Cichlidogyrus casuarinus TaxID=1844966 RepID=A0ABD2QG47_9PLAT
MLALFSVESALLLWQPWQWQSESGGDVYSTVADSSGVGLVELSLRLRQFRPKISSAQWDTLLCLVSSWLTQLLDSPDNHGLAHRLFRMVAALGALFLEPAATRSIWLDQLLIGSTVLVKRSEPSAELLRLLSSSTSSSADSFEAFCADSDEDEDPDEEDEANNSDDNSEEEMVEDDAEGQSQDEDSEHDSDLDCEADEETNHLPKRIRPPLHTRQEWNDFFCSFTYGSLLPLLLQNSVPIGPRKPEPSSDCPDHVASLCAAFATCPTAIFVESVHERASLVMEHLLQLWGPGKTSIVDFS